MSRIVLDTQVVVWWLLGIDRLTPSARQVIVDATELQISAAILYEIEFKRRLETRRDQRTVLHDLPDDLPHRLTLLDLKMLDVTPMVAWTAARLPLDHRDPWDRIILAHAVVLDIPLVSSDAHLRNTSDARVIW